ncbi:MAG: SpoIIIAH-like family protein [Firmicutes bacterium]|nr:SpoIIIAH-like family protein [Bacillota bacterium]
MLSKKKKIIILVVMVALLVVTGYLNIALNNNVTTQTSTTTTTDFYAGYRSDRQNSRETAIMYYDSIIASADSSEEAKALATQSRQELIDAMEKELVVEGLLKSAGFEDAVLTTTSENVNVIVKASELSAGELAKIGKIVQEQTGKSLDNIKIIPAA